MAGIEKLVNNGIQIASQNIQKSSSVIQSVTKPVEAGPEKLTGVLSSLAMSNSVLVKKTSISPKSHRMINGRSFSIKPIQSEKEFKIILEELMQDSSYKWKNVINAFDYERAILPYVGRGDISLDINTYLREGMLKKKTYVDITDENIKKYIQVLEYGLRHLDKEYGSYSGIVYRYGDFLSKTPNYVSTSDKIQGALNIADKSNPYEKAYNIIFTNHGHKINEMQKRLGFKFAESESEILLDSSKSYVELVDSTPQLNRLREQFYQEFSKAHPNCNLEDVKLNFWQEV